MNAYFDLARGAFLAAAPFPPSREIGLEVVRAFGNLDIATAFVYVLTASLAGSVVTWLIGRGIGRVALAYGGPIARLRWAQCSGHARAHGSLLLLCSWMYMFGPLVVFFTGVLGVRFVQFFLITLIGKAIFYGYYAFF